jgi:hypothetical protein
MITESPMDQYSLQHEARQFEPGKTAGGWRRYGGGMLPGVRHSAPRRNSRRMADATVETPRG